MFKSISLLNWLLPCCSTGASSNSEKMEALLEKNNIGILSAACCDATASSKDAELIKNLEAAMKESGIHRAVIIESITAAQKQMRQLEAKADEQQKRLINTVVQLFQSNGLSIFPILIIHGRVAFYGGAPSVEMIQAKLQSQPLPSS